MKRTRIDWFVVAIAVLFAAGCGGGGCGGCTGMEPVPGGFPSVLREPNAGQIRITQTALAAVTADPAAVIGPLAGGTSTNGKIQLAMSGGILEIDLRKELTSEPPRLELLPQPPVGNNGTLRVIVRARVITLDNLVFDTPVGNCTIDMNTNAGSIEWITIQIDIRFDQDTQTNTTKIVASGTTITDLEQADYTVGAQSGGDFLCLFANAIPPDDLAGFMVGPLEDQINGQTCKACMNVADCSSPFAMSCTDNQCVKANGDCLQELGLNGRLRGSALFASLSPGTTGAIDLYEVAGGYSTSNNGGLSLGLLGAMRPAGTERDRCGPPAAPPPDISIAKSQFFQLNARPDTSTTFDVGFGLHKSQLDALAYSGYDGGLFCLTVGSSTASQLSTDTISLLSRSLGSLVENNSPMAVGLRPQRAPVIVLGKNTFKEDPPGSGTMVPDMPLLDITFQALELDFFASIDEQWNRVFTVVTDVHLTVGLQTTTSGELTPVLGNADNAFTNVSVKNSDAITESPAAVANLFPTLLALVIPQLSGSLSPISLPALGGLQLSVTDVTSVDNDQFLAIFAELVPATMPRIVDTTAELSEVIEPGPAVARDPAQWRPALRPAVKLALGGTHDNLEFSWRANGGSWSGWSTNRRPTVSAPAFWLPGLHKVEIRAREVGKPDTLDREPVVIELALGTDLVLGNGKKALANAGFHGQAGASGCSCQTSSPSSGALFALVIAGLVLVPRRRRRRAARRGFGAVVWATVIALLPGCSCGSNPCGSQDCLPGEIEHSEGGRWTSIAADTKRVMVATYDGQLGDLMAVDVTNPSDLKYVAVDGIPDETPTYDPGTYRGGIADSGPNIGAWTSIAIEGGIARIAYQDRDEGMLKYAYEEKTGGKWRNYVLDTGEATSGLYTSMVIDSDKRPAVAYLAFGVDDGAGHRTTELRLLRASIANPEGKQDWKYAVIATAPANCGGLCGAEECVAGAAVGDPQTCVTASADCGTSCADTEVCVTGTCRERFDEPTITTLPGGTGLYVSLVVLPDGRLAAAYYDMTRRALVLAAEATKGANDFVETVLDGNVVGADRGIWTTAVAGGDGTVHVAYQDALGDQLMYTTWNGAAGTPEVVDNGVRQGDRTHPVGGGASIYLDGGGPVIVYQDGLVSDVVLASKGSGSWSQTQLAQGPLLDGFSIATTTGKGTPVFAWGTIDPARTIPMGLTVSGP